MTAPALDTPGSTLPRTLRRTLVMLALLAAVCLPTPAAAQESLSYRWNLRGFVGRLAGMMFPDEGHGELRSHANGQGWVTELEITSPETQKGEFFLYGGEIDADGSTARAWSSYLWRGKSSNKRAEVAEDDVIDLASGIHVVRNQRPTRPLRLRIWTDGKIYPVVVTRAGSEKITVPAGTFQADHYKVRGLRVDNERYWKGGLDLWLAQDATATPVQIQVERGMANVRLQLLPAGR